jgi:acyl-CoA synthetase (AMP-forming)/AMP-acid ligase II
VLNTAEPAALQACLKSVDTLLLNGEVLSTALAKKLLAVFPTKKIWNLYSISECHEVTLTHMRILYKFRLVFRNTHSSMLTVIEYCRIQSYLCYSGRFPLFILICVSTVVTQSQVAMTELREYTPLLDRLAFCPVGLPSPLAPCSILDADTLLPVADGSAGELYVGGPLLARGYLNNPLATAERFPPNPFLEAGQEADPDGPANVLGGYGDRRLYRTGDTAQRLADTGMLQILGRCGFMYKVRGYTVVPGTVEAALVKRLAGVASATVVCDGPEGQEKRLVAFLVKEPTAGRSRTRSGSVGCMDEAVGAAAAAEGPPALAAAAAATAAAQSGAVPQLKAWRCDPRTGACTAIRRALEQELASYMIPAAYIEVCVCGGGGGGVAVVFV